MYKCKLNSLLLDTTQCQIVNIYEHCLCYLYLVIHEPHLGWTALGDKVLPPAPALPPAKWTHWIHATPVHVVGWALEL